MAASELSLLTERIEALEALVAQLKAKLEAPPTSTLPWWELRWGIFNNDPDYEKAMELGRKYRESLRPKSSKTKSRKSTHKTSVKPKKR